MAARINSNSSHDKTTRDVTFLGEAHRMTVILIRYRQAGNKGQGPPAGRRDPAVVRHVDLAPAKSMSWRTVHLGTVGRRRVPSGDSVHWRLRAGRPVFERDGDMRGWAGCRGLLAAAVTLACLLLAMPTPAGAAPSDLPIGTLAQGVIADATDPGGVPPGMNNWSCHPAPEHPFPVILLHGTLFNENLSWQALSPELADAGYCVFGLDYGGAADTSSGVYGEADIGASAEQLASYVGRVLAATGSSQVDIVGHSQGGMMPRYYMKFLGGAPKVHLLIGLAPSNHGTTLDGTNVLFAEVHGLGIDAFTLAGCLACTEQINGSGSNFMATLNAGGDTVPGPNYVVIETRDDEVVTPYTSAFLLGPEVRNIVLQHQCPLDFSDHIGITYDPVALQDVMNALGADNPSFRPACSFVPPVLG
jgi:hypothetical protein